MIKTIKIYENITDFNDFHERGDFIKGVYKDSEEKDIYFVSGGKMSMRPGNAPVNYNILMAIKFDNIEAAIEKDYSKTEHISVHAFDFLRFEIIEIEN
ncbi:hypothetical protein EGI22_20245 [Lacihabitans sp. LS3-19]|uniref:hypothetical protein n=1 Tax=Lacihabitans sp. LS3-19 TaxID=2487335 RepID=UPI0020CDFD45|nr:hypothetical protein [Lacihabitans sp. LS3-19]MCP9770242.1 hypothetical protein [Lacihabitans sp. LS3-19]